MITLQGIREIGMIDYALTAIRFARDGMAGWATHRSAPGTRGDASFSTDCWALSKGVVVE